MIRLDEIQENKIINEGKAGLVQNLSLEVLYKTQEHSEGFPDFKFIFSENNGANIDIGYYYFNKRPGETEREEGKRANNYLRRLMHIVKAVMGQDFSPTQNFENMQDATDFCVKTIEENAKDKSFDIFINFGTKRYPSKRGFLEIRYNLPFVRSAGQEALIKLTPNNDDILEKDSLDIYTKDNDDDISDIVTKKD